MSARLLRPVLFAALVAALPAVAADDDTKPGPNFKRADADGDGKVSRAEFLKEAANLPRLKGDPDRAGRLFDRFDADKDGFLSADEFRKLREDGPKGKPGGPFPRPEKPADAAAKSFNDTPTPEQVAFFERKIRPVLVDQCQKCHDATAPDKVKGELTLDTRDGLRAGGASGPVIAPGDPAKSTLIRAIRYKDENLRMPPKQSLPDAVVADFEAWVRMGAPDPRAAGVAAKPHAEIDIAKGRQFWAFQPPKAVAPPTVKDAAWPVTDVDRFLLAALEAKGLKPVADADPYTLCRRIYLDLTGLPPTPSEADAFVKAASHDPQSAIGQLADTLLASPAFGERWGRHWLDVARYAESTGKSVNFNYPHAWRYRDYVIAAFNADVPFDRFVTEQLAGDLLPNPTPDQVVATGFLALGTKSLNERVRLQFEMDLVDEQIDAVSQAFLGVTAACARCHDHKFDPIPQRDYYALAGIFRSTETCYGTINAIQSRYATPLLKLPADAPAGMPPLSPREREQIERQLKQFKGDLEEMTKKSARDSFLSANGVRFRIQIAMLEAKLALYDADGTPKRQAMGVREKSRPANSPLFARGEVEKPGEVVPRGVLQVVGTSQPKIASGSGRKELAAWVASSENPLTARVYVNRVWQHLFGRGIVSTPDNFGSSGARPSNPALLDYLAVQFARGGWSTKALAKQLVTSHAYRLSAAADAKNIEADPDNALVWRTAPGRLDAEAIRDSLLAVSGQLDRTPPRGSPVARGGDGYSAAMGRPGPFASRQPADETHRSVYLPIVRDNLPESLALFDAADPSLVTGERANTTVPAQALFLMNNPFVLKAADAAAGNLLAAPGTDADRVAVAYRTFFARPPSAAEVQSAESFLAKYAAEAKKSKRQAWAALCQAMFGSAEFLMRN